VQKEYREEDVGGILKSLLEDSSLQSSCIVEKKKEALSAASETERRWVVDRDKEN